mmetsp:Transcript_78996/g.205332  ORF Transcript_78996/g.205332 Transcript_78996/m.205332 type:complete len:276 (-) Transcript_78996:523-1350(-)
MTPSPSESRHWKIFMARFWVRKLPWTSAADKNSVYSIWRENLPPMMASKLLSKSASLSPRWARPLSISALVSTPSLFVSRAANCIRNSRKTSSTSTHATIVLKMACFKHACVCRALRLSTKGRTRFLRMVVLLVFKQTHSWSSASSAEIRDSGRFSNKAQIKDLASSDTRSQHSLRNSSRPTMICFCNRSKDFPPNGNLPLRRINAIMPKLQMSHLLSYLPFQTCGDMYEGVPTFVSRKAPGSRRLANPKSISFNVLCSIGASLRKRKFSALMSR